MCFDMQGESINKFPKIRFFLFPDKPNKKRLVFFVGIMFFWYQICVISVMTNNNFIYLSSALLKYLSTESIVLATMFLVIIFLILSVSLFNCIVFNYFKYVLLFDACAMALEMTFGVSFLYPGYTLRNIYFYNFFKPFLSIFPFNKFFNSIPKETIGANLRFFFVIGFLVMLDLAYSNDSYDMR
jgi:hypothetical protein